MQYQFIRDKVRMMLYKIFILPLRMLVISRSIKLLSGFFQCLFTGAVNLFPFSLYFDLMFVF